ncbi:MAG TPA: hypothetical protein VGK59_10965 [Ohtaekwangia sp.]
MYSERLVNTLNEIANRYQGIIYDAVYDVISKKPYKNTGAGAESLRIEITSGDANTAPVVNILFDDHLIYLNNRKLEWTKLPNMEGLIAWAKTKEPDEKRAKRLAFAVGWDKAKHDTWKARPWRKKSLSKVLKEMNQMIVAEFDKAIEADLQEAARVL